MSSDKSQSFANHAKMVTGYHYVTGLLVIAYFGWSAYRAMTMRDVETHYDLVGACALLGVYAYVRIFPLQAQNRVIRLEEQLRLARVLPADLATRVHEIAPRHLIALRFASDDELAPLVRDVLAGTLTESKAIKQRITHWRADHYRL